MFNSDFSKQLEKILEKIRKKDPKLYVSIQKKVFQVISCDVTGINHYKNLRKPLNHLKRVHIGSFVLTFQVKNNIIFFENFGHHDNAY